MLNVIRSIKEFINSTWAVFNSTDNVNYRNSIHEQSDSKEKLNDTRVQRDVLERERVKRISSKGTDGILQKPGNGSREEEYDGTSVQTGNPVKKLIETKEYLDEEYKLTLDEISKILTHKFSSGFVKVLPNVVDTLDMSDGWRIRQLYNNNQGNVFVIEGDKANSLPFHSYPVVQNIFLLSGKCMLYTSKIFNKCPDKSMVLNAGDMHTVKLEIVRSIFPLQDCTMIFIFKPSIVQKYGQQQFQRAI